MLSSTQLHSYLHTKSVMQSPISSNFLEWLHKHDVIMHSIAAGFVDEGWRGVVATNELSAGALLLQVPEPVLMTTTSAARDSAFAKGMKAHAVSLSPEQVLTAHLLYEASKGSSSFWFPYIRQLPHEYSLMMNFGHAHIVALQLPHAKQLAQAACDHAMQQWSSTKPLLATLGVAKWCSQKAWLWAASTVCSRTMHIPFCPAGALMPFGDLHNYHPPPAPHYPDIEGVLVNEDRAPQDDEDFGDGGYHESFQEYCLYARKRYCKGEQVFLCYGKYTNLELLEHYGFVLGSNPHDQALIPPSLLPKTFVAYLTQNSCNARQCFLHCNGIPSWTLLEHLRCFAATPSERRQLGHLAKAGERISMDGDIKVFQLLKDTCAAILQACTSLEQDEQILRQSAADACMVAAVSWRMSYKRCMHSGIGMAEQALQALNRQAAKT